MLTGFLTLAGTLLAILFYELKRRDARADNPLNQNAKSYAQIDADLVKRDALTATAHADADLDELERLQSARGNQR